MHKLLMFFVAVRRVDMLASFGCDRFRCSLHMTTTYMTVAAGQKFVYDDIIAKALCSYLRVCPSHITLLPC